MKKPVLYLVAIVFLISCDDFHLKELPVAENEIQIGAGKSNQVSKHNPDTGPKEESQFIQAKNSSTVWTQDEKTTFMTACVDGTTETMGDTKSANYCACLLGKLEELYPVADEVINLPEEKQNELCKECQQR